MKRRYDFADAPIDRWLGALDPNWKPSRNPDVWYALCPTHEDTRPSLVIRRNEDGMVWFKCWAGCEKEKILEALNLSWRDCWENSHRDHGRLNAVYAGGDVLPLHLRRTMERMLKRDDRRAA